jgi:hypothetical protein
MTTLNQSSMKTVLSNEEPITMKQHAPQKIYCVCCNSQWVMNKSLDNYIPLVLKIGICEFLSRGKLEAKTVHCPFGMLTPCNLVDIY